MVKIKEIAKCKHPNSRKTIALVKQIKKSQKKDKNKLNSNLKLNLLGEKILWFQSNIETSYSILSGAQILEVIYKYLARFNDELKQIKLKHSIGHRQNRQHANREDIINLTIKRENEEFNTCGIEIPDLLNPQQFELLKIWNGELRYLQNFKLRRFSKKFLESEMSK